MTDTIGHIKLSYYLYERTKDSNPLVKINNDSPHILPYDPIRQYVSPIQGSTCQLVPFSAIEYGDHAISYTQKIKDFLKDTSVDVNSQKRENYNILSGAVIIIR